MTNLSRSNFQDHPFHLVSPSPWPLYTSICLLNLTTNAALAMHNFNSSYITFFISLILVISSMTLWFRDIISESTFLGDHTLAVQKGLNLGVILFIVSEALFFIAIFWAFFHSSLSPDITLGNTWPPYGIVALDPFAIPLLNTVLLLSSGEEIRHIWECYFNSLSNINIKLEYTFLQSINLFPLIPSFVKHLPSRKNKCQ